MTTFKLRSFSIWSPPLLKAEAKFLLLVSTDSKKRSIGLS